MRKPQAKIVLLEGIEEAARDRSIRLDNLMGDIQAITDLLDVTAEDIQDKEYATVAMRDFLVRQLKKHHDELRCIVLRGE